MRVRTAWVLALLLIGACAREPAAPAAPATGSSSTPSAGSSDCTFETPLVPGVPGSPGHLLPSDINPNGASELAALMRTMTADLDALRTTLDAAPSLPLHARHSKIRCAWPTDPSERTPQFDAFAVAYLGRVQALDAAPPAERKAAFDAVISACTSCHEQSCTGPIPRIEKLRL